MFDVEWQNPVDSVDVKPDGVISPIDALLVINEINRTSSRRLPDTRPADAAQIDTNGDNFLSPIDALLIINTLNQNIAGQGKRLVRETDSFVAEQLVTVGTSQSAGTRKIQLRIEPSFAALASDSISQDLFAIYVVSNQDTSRTLLHSGKAGTPVFAIGRNSVDVVPGVSNWNGQVLELDITPLAVRSATLKLQMLNGDGKSGSQATVSVVSNAIDPEGVASESLLPAQVAVQPGNQVDVASFSARTDMRMSLRNIGYDSTANRLQTEIRLSNDGTSTGKNVVATFPNLPNGAVVENASGVTSTGVPYINFASAMINGGLGKLDSTLPINVTIANPNRLPIVLKPQFFVGQPNRSPSLATVPTIALVPGETTEIVLAGTDPDNDSLRYSISTNVPLPKLAISVDGKLAMSPTPDDVGRFDFQAFVSDGLLQASQPVQVQVNSDPVTTTRVSGKVLDVDGMPLVGVRVEMGSIQGLTQADGSFLLDLGAIAPVTDTLKRRNRYKFR